MFTNTNRWRRINYTLLTPIYDALIGVFARFRKKSLDIVALQPGERVLIVGAGTGADLDFLQPGPDYVAIDLTPSMMARLRGKARRLGLDIDAHVMDGMAMDFEDSSFDVAVIHLLLSVIPDPRKCMMEMARVVRSGGRAVVLDKFVRREGNAPLALRLVNPLMSLLGTEVTRRLEPMIAGTPWRVLSDTGMGAGGFYRVILLERT